MSKRILARLCALPMAAAVTVLVAAPASAHVTVSPTKGTAGSYTVLTFSVPHGCDGSPTTKVAIKMPESIYSVTPTRNPFWTVEKVMVQLDEPITGPHGNTVTERVGKVVYTAQQPLPPGQRDEFELSLKLPDRPGKTLVFPTIQYCKQGKTGWVQVPAEGQSAHTLPRPAPTVTLLPAGAMTGHAAGSGSAAGSNGAAEPGNATGSDGAAEPDSATTSVDDTGTTSAETAPVAAEAEGTSAWGIAGFVAGLLALVIAAGALLLARRRA